jgi:hypothetical protein
MSLPHFDQFLTKKKILWHHVPGLGGLTGKVGVGLGGQRAPDVPPAREEGGILLMDCYLDVVGGVCLFDLTRPDQRQSERNR